MAFLILFAKLPTSKGDLWLKFLFYFSCILVLLNLVVLFFSYMKQKKTCIVTL